MKVYTGRIPLPKQTERVIRDRTLYDRRSNRVVLEQDLANENDQVNARALEEEAFSRYERGYSFE